MYDLLHTVNAKRKPKPHPIRPWGKTNTQTLGRTGGRSRAEVADILARMGRGEL